MEVQWLKEGPSHTLEALARQGGLDEPKQTLGCSRHWTGGPELLGGEPTWRNWGEPEWTLA